MFVAPPPTPFTYSISWLFADSLVYLLHSFTHSFIHLFVVLLQGVIHFSTYMYTYGDGRELLMRLKTLRQISIDVLSKVTLMVLVWITSGDLSWAAYNFYFTKAPLPESTCMNKHNYVITLNFNVQINFIIQNT